VTLRWWSAPTSSLNAVTGPVVADGSCRAVPHLSPDTTSARAPGSVSPVRFDEELQMRGRKRTTTRVMVAGLAGLAGLAVVGGATAAAASAKPSTHIVKADATSAAPTSVSFSLTGSLTGGSSSVATAAAVGQVDFTHDALSAQLNLPAGVGPSVGGAGPIRVVMTGGTVYASVPALSSLPGGKPWVSFPLPSGSGATIAKGFSRAARSLGDVNRLVSLLQAHHATVKPLGTQTVDGVTASGYEVDLSIPKIMSDLPGVPSSIGQQALGTARTVPVQLWADPLGRLVRASVAVSRASSSSGPKSVSAQVDFTGYDSPVTIVAPPADQTTPLPSGLLPMISGMLGGAKSGLSGALGASHLFGGALTHRHGGSLSALLHRLTI
jgi:hypothetical protein